MTKLKREEEKQIREKKALEWHHRLHKLFIENRFVFERERKRMIDEFFAGVEDEDMRKKLKEWQTTWDKKMRNAGSAHNRLVLAQTLFWSHFHESWLPKMQAVSEKIKDKIPNL